MDVDKGGETTDGFLFASEKQIAWRLGSVPNASV